MNPALSPGLAGRWSSTAARGAALSVFALIGVVLFGTLAGQQLIAAASPERAVASYYSALAAGDASTAWALGSYGTGPLISAGALRSMLALPANRDFEAVRVEGAREAGRGRYLVDVSYTRQGRAYTGELTVSSVGGSLGALPAWRVAVPPARLALAGVTGAGALSVDGIRVPAAAAAAGLAVIPGSHLVVEAASAVSSAQTLTVESDGSVVARLTPAVPPQLRAASASVLRDAFAGCVRSADLRPGGCPISAYRRGDSVSGVTWTPVGDQLAGADFSVGPEPMTVAVSGGWRMLVSYDYSYLGLEEWPEHREAVESGRWLAVLQKVPEGLRLLSFEGA